MAVEKKIGARERLQMVQQAYARVFEPKSPYVQLVLEDLREFCRLDESCFHPDPRAHALAEGRREVGMRIIEHSQLSFEELETKMVRRYERLRKGNK
jgi:hypothetical protein